MNIQRLQGREVYDSQVYPTLACDLFLEDGRHVTTMVPSGTSKGVKEAQEMRDGGERLFGLGVQNAVEVIKQKIAPLFVGRPINALEMDVELLQLDPSSNKSLFGANTMLAVSMALYKAHALAAGVELFHFIAQIMGGEAASMPMPMINVINGGAHADNNLSIQEFLLIPYGAKHFDHAMQVSMEVYHTLKRILVSDGRSVYIGLEGGMMPSFENMYQPLDCIMNAIK